MIAISLFGSYHIYYYFLDKSNNDLIRDYYIINTIEEPVKVVKTINKEEKEEYLGILKIPKINLKEGFYNINSKNNNINKSVMILKESLLPSGNGSIIYLTAHSGTGYLAFFKDLNKLSINDIIYLDIGNHSYQYTINDIYELNKNGKIMVNHNINEDYLVLTTCLGKDKQLVVTSKLINNDI
jgi:LPXTG-site transpeptidase (sortase) family protein